MALRPPRPPSTKLWSKTPYQALEYEIIQEQASALGRLGRRLEAALAALAAFDSQNAPATTERKQERGALIKEASLALWLLVVQRESLGLRDTRQLLRDYSVPAEVRDRMGIV